LYDAGLVGKQQPVKNISYSDVYEKLQTDPVNQPDTAKNVAVKYRTIIGTNDKEALQFSRRHISIFIRWMKLLISNLCGTAIITANCLADMAWV
jgi:hypothetical protein